MSASSATEQTIMLQDTEVFVNSRDPQRAAEAGRTNQRGRKGRSFRQYTEE